nr:COX15/CtaA family protein [Prochlorococcus marinus]
MALVALVVVGGATRVMEAGLACPDWPLCYGSFFPKGQMNIQVFLEWFHRLDAFFVGVSILVQFFFSLTYKSLLPKWFPWINGVVLFLILLQGALGALTVFELLSSIVVISHLLIALSLVALMSGLVQRLLQNEGTEPPVWWKLSSGCSLLAVIVQSLVGGRVATTWSARRCIAQTVDCQWLDLHRFTAFPVALCIISFVAFSLYKGGWFREQWPFLAAISGLLILQIMLGVFSVHLNLNEPLVTVFHQLVATLLVAFTAALSFRRPNLIPLTCSRNFVDSAFEACHG